MIKLLKRAGAVLARGYGLESLSPKTWATVCAPDDIIVAQILEKIAKSPSDWKYSTGFHPLRANWKWGGYYYISDGNRGISKGVATLSGPDGLSAVFGAKLASTDKNSYYEVFFDKTCTIGGIILNESTSVRFLAALDRWHEGHEEAARVTAKAKADMETNEKKWNLAEQLSGMVRNERGALIPKPKWMYTGRPAPRPGKRMEATTDSSQLHENCPDCGEKSRRRIVGHTYLDSCPKGCGYVIFMP